MSLTTAADSPVAAVLAGHVHLSDESVIDGEKDIPQIVRLLSGEDALIFFQCVGVYLVVAVIYCHYY